jgi:hypothetical protein
MDLFPNERLLGPSKTFTLKNCIILLVLASLVSADGTVSIAYFSAYPTQRNCVQYCLTGEYEEAGDNWVSLLGYLNCPGVDSCMCRADLSASATNWIYTCASQICSSDSTDMSAAVSIFTAYCEEAMTTAQSTYGVGGGTSTAG